MQERLKDIKVSKRDNIFGDEVKYYDYEARNHRNS